MSYAVILDMQIENIDESTVKNTMDALGWEGEIVDKIDDTIYFQASGQICIGTSEYKQEQIIRNTFNKKMNRKVGRSISFDD